MINKIHTYKVASVILSGTIGLSVFSIANQTATPTYSSGIRIFNPYEQSVSLQKVVTFESYQTESVPTPEGYELIAVNAFPEEDYYLMVFTFSNCDTVEVNGLRTEHGIDYNLFGSPIIENYKDNSFERRK